MLVTILFVPKQMAAAVIWPTKYDTLKSDVRTGRSLGYASSPIREEADTMHVGMPNPRIRRATMYIPAADQYPLVRPASIDGLENYGSSVPLTEKPWIKAPMTMIMEPPMIDQRRPNLSLTTPINGSETMAPSE